MAFMDIFRTTPAAPAATPAPAAPATPAPGNGQPVPPGNIPNPADVTAQNQQQQQDATAMQQQQPETPLAQFEKLWETVPNPTPGTETPPATPALTAEVIGNALKNANFTAAIPAEHFAAISAGGDEAAVALQQIVQSVASTAITQSLLIGNKLQEKAISEALAKQAAEIPGLLRSQSTSDHLKNTNPVFNNPAIKPVVEATKQQLLQRFPNATPQEITQMTQDYIIAMGQAFAPAATTDESGQAVDWNQYINS